MLRLSQNQSILTPTIVYTRYDNKEMFLHEFFGNYNNKIYICPVGCTSFKALILILNLEKYGPHTSLNVARDGSPSIEYVIQFCACQVDPLISRVGYIELQEVLNNHNAEAHGLQILLVSCKDTFLLSFNKINQINTSAIF